MQNFLVNDCNDCTEVKSIFNQRKMFKLDGSLPAIVIVNPCGLTIINC
jgi:hypothetical protein